MFGKTGQVQARMATLVRGLKSRPENALDYGEALEFQLFQLDQAIDDQFQEEFRS